MDDLPHYVRRVAMDCMGWPARIAAVLALASGAAFGAEATDAIDFNRDIRPVLSDACYTCHGPDEATREADLRLDQRDAAFADLGGYAAIVPGDVEESELIARITAVDADERMPPPDSGHTLKPQQVALLRRWIEQGAKWDNHWSFIPPRRAAPPTTKNSAWQRNGIDAFVLARLEREGFTPSPEAAKETLIRRVTLDLTGLPPTLEEIDAFLADESADAYEKVVDRLLASPRYGEHMALAWLDAARYSDTNGYQNDATRTMWPWRDWVIRALNENMPYDRFTIEQIAGDLLPDATLDQRVATGFHRNHMLNGEGGSIPEESRVEYVVNRVETTSTVWLGLTMGCARCHSHKYDPISQKEFYQVFAFFNQVAESGDVDHRGVMAVPVLAAPTREQAENMAALETQIAALDERLQKGADLSPDGQHRWEGEASARIARASDQPGWDMIVPDSVESASGASVTRLDDFSTLLEGVNPDQDSYTVTFTVDAAELRGLRLEARWHPSFTRNGQARSDSGNFVLSELEVSVQQADEPEPRPVKLASAVASYEQGGFPVAHAIDGKPETGWAVHASDMQHDRTAVFTFAEPVVGGPGTRLIVRLKHSSVYKHHNIGRFCMYVTAAPQPALDAVTLPPGEVIAALLAEESQRTEAQTHLLTSYYRAIAERQPEVRRALDRVRRSRIDLERAMPVSMVMQDRPEPRKTYLLMTGQYDKPDTSEELSPGVPASLPTLAEGAPSNRLGLARWLVDAKNPLTARVAANRYWQRFFGTGLVKTVDDLGVQGERPSHPELLDWLATEFVRSGWDVKHMHRLIVTSATYRQSSKAAPDRLERDPYNRLLSRGPRFRLSSQAIRDQALALSGLLVEKLGGPPVRPYQPAGVWEEFSLGQIVYKPDEGESLYRRSLYTFWRRSVGPTNLFDSSARQVCSVLPRRTNTPLHSLTLLNDVTYTEAARVFAERAMREGGQTPEERIATAFRMATARQPSQAEKDVLRQSFERVLAQYRADEKAALELVEVGQSPRVATLDPVELAAYTNVMSVILNLDEVITKE